jgi:hypothetical protein
MKSPSRKWTLAWTALVVLTPAVIYAANLTIPNTFNAGTSIQSAQMNANFQAVQTAVNTKQDATVVTCPNGQAVISVAANGTTSCGPAAGGGVAGISATAPVLVSSTSVTNATNAAVALPAGYSSFWVVGTVQNTSTSAKSLFFNVGGDVGNNYNWSVFDQYEAGNQQSGCDPSNFVECTDSLNNVNRVAPSAFVMFTYRISIPSSSPPVLMVEGTAQVSINDVNTSASHHLQGLYTGVSQTQLNFGFYAPSSCTSETQAANAMSGKIYVYAIPSA